MYYDLTHYYYNVPSPDSSLLHEIEFLSFYRALNHLLFSVHKQLKQAFLMTPELENLIVTF